MYALPKLAYGYDALAPIISEALLRLHHDKHHAANVNEVEQIGNRIKEKLDWREYVKDSPYLTLGAAAGLGYFGSRIFKKRTTPVERFLGSIGQQVGDSLGGLLAGAAGPGLIKVTLMGIATKAAIGWMKSAAAPSQANEDAGPKPRTEGGASSGSRVDT